MICHQTIAVVVLVGGWVKGGRLLLLVVVVAVRVVGVRVANHGWYLNT